MKGIVQYISFFSKKKSCFVLLQKQWVCSVKNKLQILQPILCRKHLLSLIKILQVFMHLAYGLMQKTPKFYFVKALAFSARYGLQNLQFVSCSLTDRSACLCLRRNWKYWHLNVRIKNMCPLNSQCRQKGNKKIRPVKQTSQSLVVFFPCLICVSVYSVLPLSSPSHQVPNTHLRGIIVTTTGRNPCVLESIQKKPARSTAGWPHQFKWTDWVIRQGNELIWLFYWQFLSSKFVLCRGGRVVVSIFTVKPCTRRKPEKSWTESPVLAVNQWRTTFEQRQYFFLIENTTRNDRERDPVCHNFASFSWPQSLLRNSRFREKCDALIKRTFVCSPDDQQNKRSGKQDILALPACSIVLQIWKKAKCGPN